ncbi:MAG: histidine phosphatase family protein [Clostridia bacterium]|nr:histidine phosphatase family protein [Clostridia bacterium]
MDEKDIRFFLVRHAQSWGNINSPDAPSYQPDDPPLTPEGLAQAERLAERFEPGMIEHIYASTLVRTAQTVQPTAEKLGLPILLLPELREMDTFIPGGSPEEFARLAPRAVFVPGRDAPPLVGMDAAYTAARADAALEYIAASCPDGSSVIVCAHGSFFGYLIRRLLGIQLPETFCWKVDNCSVTEIQLRKGKIPKLCRANSVQ